MSLASLRTGLLFALLCAPLATSHAEEILAKDPAERTAQARQEAAVIVADEQKPAAAQQSIQRMHDIVAKITANVEEARDEVDVIKLNCVNEKLTAVKGLLKVSELSSGTLQSALGRREIEVAAHEFDKVMLAQRKCEQLLAESESCVGELAVYSGETETETIIEGIDAYDPTADPDGHLDMDKDHEDSDPSAAARPPEVSPFQ
jgi:hypothetical protein